MLENIFPNEYRDMCYTGAASTGLTCNCKIVKIVNPWNYTIGSKIYR